MTIRKRKKIDICSKKKSTKNVEIYQPRSNSRYKKDQLGHKNDNIVFDNNNNNNTKKLIAKMLRVSKVEPSKSENLNNNKSHINYRAWILLQDITTNDNKYGHEQEEDVVGIYRSLRLILTVAILLGFMPISIVKLSFKWFSLRTIYSVFLIGALSFNAYLEFYFFAAATSGINNVRFLAITFERPLRAALTAFAVLFTVNLSRHIANILKQYNDTTRPLIQYVKVVNGNLRRNDCFRYGTVCTLSIVAFTFIFLATGETLFYDLRLYTSVCCENTTTFLECYSIHPYGGAQLTEAAFSGSHSVIITCLAYVLNIISKLAFMFNDFFVCFMSVALRANFNIITQFLMIASPRTAEQWKTLRHNHFKLCVLVKTVDKHIAHIILQSIVINVYGLCHHIYFAIRPSPVQSNITVFNTWYNFFSVAQITVRVCAVIFTATKLTNEVREPVPLLHRCPKQAFSNEVVHFINQICGGETVGFTGCRFFNLTQYLVFGIGSLVFTYEVILLNTKNK